MKNTMASWQRRFADIPSWQVVVFWMVMAVLFAGWIAVSMSVDKAALFMTGYITEWVLSVDNLFVIKLAIVAFGLNFIEQKTVLNLGIFGAIILRGILIFSGSFLLGLQGTFNLFQYPVHVSGHWILYGFGLLLLMSAIKMIFENEEKGPDQKLINFSKSLGLSAFFACLIVVEISDVVFALDSIPAIFSVTTDSFIVFTSNIFAVMGLRALYFLLDDFMKDCENLNQGIASVLIFISLKILMPIFGPHYEIAPILSLGIIVAILLPHFLPVIVKRINDHKQEKIKRQIELAKLIHPEVV